MISKNNLLQSLFLVCTAIAIVVIVIPLVAALPCYAEEQPPSYASHSVDSARPEGAAAVQQEKPADESAKLSQADEPNLVRQANEGTHKHKIRVGLYENKPKVYTNDKGQPAGIFIELLEYIAQKENWDLVYVPCEWVGCLNALQEARIDLMPDVAYAPERARVMDFNKEKVIESWSQIYTNKTIPVRNISDLNGRRIALLSGSIQQTTLGQLIKGFGYKVSFVSTDSYEEAFSLAANGTVDMVVSNNLFGGYFYEKYGLLKTAIVFNPTSLYFATTPGANHEILEAIDHDLRLVKSEPGSVFYQTLANWMERPPKTVVPRYLVWIIGGIVAFLVLAFVIILLLRSLVIKRTGHLDKVNKKLLESEEKFRRIFQDHSAVKLIIDPESGNIVEVNGAAEKFYGWPAEQLRQKRIQDISDLSPEEVEAEIKTAEQYFQSRQKLADGSVKDVEVFTSTIDIKGKKLVHYIIHDVTEHRKLEEQYRQAQKMESVGRLAGGVAHDYNNMLGVILGYTDLALLEVEPSESMYDYLKEIQNAARCSTDITSQLLAFARKQTGTPKVIDVNEIAESMIMILRRLIGEDIELVWRPENNLRPVKIDPSQIEQILANLCVNARDAIAGVGKVTIETHMVSIDESYCADHYGSIPGEFVMLSVSDDGSGMDKETLNNIFEPFFTTKDVHSGTGLGLATVYGIVKQNNGFINVDSEPGKGASFKIYLPCHAAEVDEIRDESVSEISPGSNETVLVVEDDAATRQMVWRMLEKLEYKVLVAGTAEEALRIAGEHPDGIQLVITDVIMPGMNGRDLADALRSSYPNIKVLFMSGYTADVIAQRGMLDDDMQYIQKPFSMREMGIKVREILDEE